MEIYRILSILMILAISFNELKGEGGKVEDLDYNYKQFNSIIYLTAGYVFSAGSKDFFKAYTKYTGGDKDAFVFVPLAGAGTKFQFWKKFRIGLETELFYAKMLDAYIQVVPDYNENDYRAISQDISVKSYPSFVTLEYIPMQQQFRTYTGIGFGAVFSDIYWNEVLSTSIPFDKRHGGEHFNEFEIHPAARLYAGLELGFDKEGSENFVGSLILEVKYTAMFRSVSFFAGIERQFEKPQPGISDEYSILPGYLGIYSGLTFNFNRRGKLR